MEKIINAISATKDALESFQNSNWIIGFSGGKDSTALLKIFSSAVREAKFLPNNIRIIYCDTGVENPVLDHYVMKLFSDLKKEFGETSPFKIKILRAPIKDRFFVKIIGRGYPPPTNSFRWCTKNLRINPVSNYIHQAAEADAIVALGMRLGESQQRNRSLQKNGTGLWQEQIESGHRYRLFLPIINLDVEDVWEAVFTLPTPTAIKAELLADLYRGASGECPLVKSPNSPPCASGRFGCWTCTVVRKDKSSMSLIEAGRTDLLPYLQFRNWLAEIRNDKLRRWPRRRNGKELPGPFTLAARREILDRLRELESTAQDSIVSPEELAEIHRLWTVDIELEKTFENRLGHAKAQRDALS